MSEILPQKLDATSPEALRRVYKIVRLDSYADVPGDIVAADTQAGTCTLKDKGGEDKSYELQRRNEREGAGGRRGDRGWRQRPAERLSGRVGGRGRVVAVQPAGRRVDRSAGHQHRSDRRDRRRERAIIRDRHAGIGISPAARDG